MANNNEKQPLNDVAEEVKDLSQLQTKKKVLEAINDTPEPGSKQDIKKKEKILERIDE